MGNANDTQWGGTHYKQFKGLEPWDVITYWNLGYLDGTALKYIARWKHKNGIEDLRKAIHFLEKAVEVETARRADARVEQPSYVAALHHPAGFRPAVERLCDVCPVDEQTGDSLAFCDGQLNDVPIMRPDNEQH